MENRAQWIEDLLKERYEQDRHERAQNIRDRHAGLQRCQDGFLDALKRYLQLEWCPTILVDHEPEPTNNWRWFLSANVDGVEFTYRPLDGHHTLQGRVVCECGGDRYSYPLQSRRDLADWLISEGRQGMSHRCCYPEPDEDEEQVKDPGPAAPTPTVEQRLLDALRDLIAQEMAPAEY